MLQIRKKKYAIVRIFTKKMVFNMKHIFIHIMESNKKQKTLNHNDLESFFNSP
jgi:hypothetical protein